MAVCFTGSDAEFVMHYVFIAVLIVIILVCLVVYLELLLICLMTGLWFGDLNCLLIVLLVCYCFGVVLIYYLDFKRIKCLVCVWWFACSFVCDYCV